ncbi:MAG: class I SAM-dependent methyltransferase, partial [Terriglobus roseus]|nr:class I SAM-dependent methyltransferase [Terriglobus roseus]
MASTTNPTTAPVPQEDNRSAVEQGYDLCSAAYTSTRSQDSVRELTLLTTRLPPSSKILDLGCGAGIPVALSLTTHPNSYHVTGVDISLEQIKHARLNVPAATFHHADMASPTLDAALGGPETFDAVVAFFSIFHLPRAMHADMFRR